MSILLIRLAGPLQSWGTQSRFTNRDTGREPSKSGVVGLLCAAGGIVRHDRERIGEMARLPMGVRVDREGELQKDFQTAGGGVWPGRSDYGVWPRRGGTITSARYFLADADFLVALEVAQPMGERLQEALADPVWPLFLGRKGYVPGLPVRVPDGLRAGEMSGVLATYPWLPPRRGPAPSRLRVVLECGPEEGRPRLDVPESFEPDQRSFRLRHIRDEWVPTESLRVDRRDDQFERRDE